MMLSEFGRQFAELPLISTCWTTVRDRYVQEKATSSWSMRLVLSTIEQSCTFFHGNIIEPLMTSFGHHLNPVDSFLCSHIDTIRYICPIVNQTKDEVIDRYRHSLLVSFFIRNNSSVSATHKIFNTHSNGKNQHLRQFIEHYFQFLTNILMIIEIYSKSILNELNLYIDTSRSLWKNLNMEDGRSLDEVSTYSEKILVLGRRSVGNYRQLVYLIRYRLRRSRRLLFSVLFVHNRFHSFLSRLTRMVPINHLFSDRTRSGWSTSKERMCSYLEIVMLHAINHPWMKWLTPLPKTSASVQFPTSVKLVRPMFFVPSTNTSDCSGTEDSLNDPYANVFQSTPNQKQYKQSPLIHSDTPIEIGRSDLFSTSSSSSSETLEPSFDMKDILRQVCSFSHQTSDTLDSINQEDENRLIEQALNESDDQTLTSQQPVSVFDLSPMLASGCAV